MLKRRWETRLITSYDDWLSLRDNIKHLKPEVAAFDTETTGLHIILDSPFLFQFGFLHPTNPNKGFTFLIDLRYNQDAKKIIKEWHNIVKHCKLYLGHNVKFDLHMLHNIGIPYEESNLSDTQFYIRYANDALHTDEGGPPLALKEFASRYIDSAAKYHEKLLASERTEIAKSYNIKLKQMLGVTLSTIQELFSDPIFELNDLPEQYKLKYFEWKKSLPIYLQNKVTSLVESDMIRYSDLNQDNLYKYSYLDIVYTLEIYERLAPILAHRKNQIAVDIENSNIIPLVAMERTGLLVNKEYLEQSRIRLKNNILELRKRLKELAGEDIKIGQHAKIKSILKDKYNINLESTGSQELEKYDNEFIQVIRDLRSLEKWYSTYIMKFQKELESTDRIYTTIHQVGTVSGRVSSDFQQFPKEPILDKNGDELFHPRRMVLCPKNCSELLFLDYAAEELRVTAMYTVLVGDPDTNMLRAYMPYKCTQRNSKWYLDEKPDEEWEPVDLHAATTINAGYSKDDPNFKHYRKTIGKRVNFAKNYGASYNKIRGMFPEKSEEECHRIDEAYYKAFPGLKTYHKYCFDRAHNYAYTSNMFGVKYYNISGHKLRNVLVQGSCAHFLKQRIAVIYKFLKNNNLQSRIAMQIHDELMYEIVKGEEWIIPKLKELQEDWHDAPVPIIAEAEHTTTNWAEKYE